jgi:murein DD-endopeptidase MepM/ murein hydrolase activator NlpD
VTLRMNGAARRPGSGNRFARWSSSLQRRARFGWVGAVGRALPAVLVLIAAYLPSVTAAASASSRTGESRRSAGPGARVPPFEAPLARPPLDPPVVMNGGFGEYRSNHFHAGLDLGTGGRVGRPVFAPLGGWIERVRASGVGYGRSLYLRTSDGRTLVFGHLDAFAEPVASFMAAAQESTGQYEQDLWPERDRFRVAVGQRIAWTGESGSGGPHLHFEIRRGDMAYHPVRAGLALSDTIAPTLASLTLEPLDDTSYVERGAAPYTVRLGTAPETLLVEGRVRAIVGARDGMWKGVDRMVPWSTAIEFGEEHVECRFDSASWATDMVESDYVFDTGRVVGDKGMVMWAPAGFRPRVLITSAPRDRDAGTLVVRRGDPPRALRMTARDLSGSSMVREVVLRPPRRNESGPDPGQVGGRAEPDSSRWYEIAMLPGGFARFTFRGAPAGSRHVTIDDRPASLREGDWTAVVSVAAPESPAPFSIMVVGTGASGPTWRRRFVAGLHRDVSARWQIQGEPDIDWMLDQAALFERGPIFYRKAPTAPSTPAELVPRSVTLELMPASLPLRKPLRLELKPHALDAAHVGVYSDDGSGWGWLGTALDPALGRRVAETRHLGRFALFADTLAPRIAPRRPPSRRTLGPYPRWALEARLTEEGSGVDGQGSRFEVDGRRVPSEWDAEERLLRWRPRRAPQKGVHPYTVIAVDRAGNERRIAGQFTIN